MRHWDSKVAFMLSYLSVESQLMKYFLQKT